MSLITDGATIPPKTLDDVWEMNIHLNPVDDETRLILNNHKQQLIGGSDNFATFAKHSEN